MLFSVHSHSAKLQCPSKHSWDPAPFIYWTVNFSPPLQLRAVTMKRALSHPHFGLAPWIIFLPSQTSWQDTTGPPFPRATTPPPSVDALLLHHSPLQHSPNLQGAVPWGTAKRRRVSALPKCSRSYKCCVEQKEEEEEGNRTLGNRGSYSGCPLRLQELTAFPKKPKEKLTEPQGWHCPPAALWQPSGVSQLWIHRFPIFPKQHQFKIDSSHLTL